MKITYRCTHTETVRDAIATPPTCLVCGERRITRVETRPPRIRGWATGPHVQTERLDAVGVQTGTPLLVGTQVKD